MLALPLVRFSNGISARWSWHQIKLVGACEKWRCRDADMAPCKKLGALTV